MSAKFMVNLSLSLKIRISDISRSSCAATVIILNLHGDKILTSSDMYNHNILKLKLYALNIPTQIKKTNPNSEIIESTALYHTSIQKCPSWLDQ